MTYKDTNPTYNVNRNIVNFKDFDSEGEKSELKKMKRYYKKNELEIGQRERKYKYNKVTRKLDDMDKSEVVDKLEESNSHPDKDVMKYLKSFKEALMPSQFRKYVKEFNRERYEEKFQEFKKKYDGDRNAWRLYLPYNEVIKKSETETEIEDIFSENGYEIIDYISGVAKYKDAKNNSKIGKVLNLLLNKSEDKEKISSLIKKFVEDPIRKSGRKKMLVCISRHPYDIAGADTDRKWTNCMTIGTNHSKKIVDLENQLSKLDKKNDYSTIKNIESKLNDIKRDGENVRYLLQDTKEGSLIAYLIEATDKNINNPIANLNIKPYININKNDSDDFILVSDSKMYGNGNEIFKKIVDDFLEEFNGNKKGLFCLNKKLYYDGGSNFKNLYDNIDELIDNTEKFNFDTIIVIINYLHNYNGPKVNLSKIANNIDYNSISVFIKDSDDDYFDDNLWVIGRLLELLIDLRNYDGASKIIEITSGIYHSRNIEILDFVDDIYPLIIDIIDKKDKKGYNFINFTTDKYSLEEFFLYMIEFEDIEYFLELIKIKDLKFKIKKRILDQYDYYIINFSDFSIEFEDYNLYKKLLKNKNRER